MALTIKMRIDEQPEHSYVFSTDGGQIELIPLSVVQNGNYASPEGKAYNLVSVNVPVTILDSLNITENGTYEAEDGHAYDVVTVNVEPLLELVSRSYTSNGTYTIEPSEGYDGLEKAVVTVNVSGSSPVLIEKNINANGTYNASSDNADGYSKVVANVPNTYSASDEGKVVDNGALVAQTSQSITQNGTYDTTLKNEAVVNVPNTYSASDEGKVVDNGALVAQTLQNITQNGTYNTTLNDEVVVNVSGGGGGDSDVVDGTFTVGDTSSVEEVVNIPYSGTKKLRGVVAFLYDGEFNLSVPGDVTLAMYIRNNPTYTPTFDATVGNGNRWSYVNRFKSSSSAYSTIAGQASIAIGDSSTALTNSNATPKIYFNSATQFRYIVSGGGGSSPGFKKSAVYRYIAIYQ